MTTFVLPVAGDFALFRGLRSACRGRGGQWRGFLQCLDSRRVWAGVRFAALPAWRLAARGKCDRRVTFLQLPSRVMGRPKAKVCRHGHPYSKANTHIDKRGHQCCRTCARDRERARKRDFSYHRTARCSGCSRPVHPSWRVLADGSRVKAASVAGELAARMGPDEATEYMQAQVGLALDRAAFRAALGP